jgi:hypothetical protein
MIWFWGIKVIWGTGAVVRVRSVTNGSGRGCHHLLILRYL